uniref:Uncharacterized protein n=1 Tax=Heterorhabditis bacteriophora TaxID=37862 RepID=A0A1I7XEP2_HETBA
MFTLSLKDTIIGNRNFERTCSVRYSFIH